MEEHNYLVAIISTNIPCYTLAVKYIRNISQVSLIIIHLPKERNSINILTFTV